MSAAIKAFLVLMALFVAHRLVSMDALTGIHTLDASGRLAAIAVGLLSDVWVAYLSAFATLIVSALVAVAISGAVARHVWLPITALFAGVVCAHQGYVDFFHFQLIPFHLNYVTDWSFLTANAKSVTDQHVLIVAATYLVAVAAVAGREFGREGPLTRDVVVFAAATVLALFAHNRNIHLRVQWFIPEHLQANAFERFYLNVKNNPMPDKLSPTEWTDLNKSLGTPWADHAPDDSEALLNALTRPTTEGADANLPPVAKRIRDEFEKSRAAGRKPMALVVLLESLRPSETGYFAPETPSLTPNLDQVYAKGITFTRAVSTGSVTRGAQEASFCGYLGSRDTSLMRGQTALPMTCLPDAVRVRASTGPKGEVFWFHGGEARFDGQLAFWQARGVGRALSLADFPDDAPRTGWGVSDRSFFASAATHLATLRKETQSDYLLGMLLSVTNHIPWDLPPDAQVSKEANKALAHPSYYTTAYTDAALGEFLSALRSDGSWQDTLIVIASDHGNNVPPLNKLYADSATRDAWLQSHVNLLMTGGLVDAALSANQMTSLSVDHLTSQADIAAFLAYASGLDIRVMGENLFAPQRVLPVISDLEEGVFDPADEHIFPRAALLKAATSDLSANERKTLLYYRTFLQFINTWRPAHGAH